MVVDQARSAQSRQNGILNISRDVEALKANPDFILRSGPSAEPTASALKRIFLSISLLKVCDLIVIEALSNPEMQGNDLRQTKCVFAVDIHVHPAGSLRLLFQGRDCSSHLPLKRERPAASRTDRSRLVAMCPSRCCPCAQI